MVRVYRSPTAVCTRARRRGGCCSPAVSVGLLVVGVVGAEIVTRRIVRPLVETSEQPAGALAAGRHCGARADGRSARDAPSSASPFNRLADRIDELIAEERETVADISHRMRTPLTALRLDAEALADPTEAERVGDDVASWSGR